MAHDKLMSHFHTETPNFSIICPGGCNSKCAFCTDPMNYKTSPDYLDNLIKALNEKNDTFNRVSVTGGEPTLSPLLKEILLLSRTYFDKVVFTTNGTKLNQHAEMIAKLIDHLNVSRHRIGYDLNTEVFKQKRIIDDKALAEVIPVFLDNGVDVNFNHVYSPADAFMNREYVSRYIDYVKNLGGTSISFRYDQNLNSLDHTFIEKEFLKTHEIVHEGYCSVCRSFSMIIDDMVVVWKSSFANPDAYMNNEVYEYIYHTDGVLRTGWDRN
jgi:molybdenum cofactor biosynthesis enzyme MoaA